MHTYRPILSATVEVEAPAAVVTPPAVPVAPAATPPLVVELARTPQAVEAAADPNVCKLILPLPIPFIRCSATLVKPG